MVFVLHVQTFVSSVIICTHRSPSARSHWIRIICYHCKQHFCTEWRKGMLILNLTNLICKHGGLYILMFNILHLLTTHKPCRYHVQNETSAGSISLVSSVMGWKWKWFVTIFIEITWHYENAVGGGGRNIKSVSIITFWRPYFLDPVFLQKQGIGPLGSSRCSTGFQ